MNEITDADRMRFLRDNGYLPSKPLDLSEVESPHGPTQFLDWALARHYCPAYWRPWTKDDPIESAQSNGMVLVKSGDRERIDQCIMEPERKKLRVFYYYAFESRRWLSEDEQRQFHKDYDPQPTRALALLECRKFLIRRVREWLERVEELPAE